MTEQVHYIADITVRKVSYTPPVTGRYENENKPEKKKVSTIAHVVVSNEELEKLVEKTNLHLTLVEDGGDIEKGSSTRGS